MPAADPATLGARGVQHVGIDAAVVGAALGAKLLWFWVRRVAEAPQAPSAATSAVKPAFIAVTTGRVAGEGVAAGVAGVLHLPLDRGGREESRDIEEERLKRGKENEGKKEERGTEAVFIYKRLCKAVYMHLQEG